MRPIVHWLVVVIAVGLLSSRSASAQTIGTFRWQLQPFCNAVTVTVVQNGGVYTLDGFDDQCGAGQRAPLVGVATPNPDGTIGLGLQIVTVPGGKHVGVDARIDLGSLGGPWSDSAGNSGTFAFNGQAAGSPRPAPAVVTPTINVTGSGTVTGGLTTGSLTTGAVTATGVTTTGPVNIGGFVFANGGGFAGPLSATNDLSVTRSVSDCCFGAALALERFNPGNAALTNGTVIGSVAIRGTDGSAELGERCAAARRHTQTWATDAHGTSAGAEVARNSQASLGTSAVVVDGNGLIGINTTTPDQQLSVNGNASKTGGASWLAFSDARLKHVFGGYTRGLDAVLALQPVRYEYRRRQRARSGVEGRTRRLRRPGRSGGRAGGRHRDREWLPPGQQRSDPVGDAERHQGAQGRERRAAGPRVSHRGHGAGTAVVRGQLLGGGGREVAERRDHET